MADAGASIDRRWVQAPWQPRGALSALRPLPSSKGTSGSEESEAKTHHWLAISLNPAGVPISVFTVNRRVTGDQLLSSEGSLPLLQAETLDTGHELIDCQVNSLVRL